MNEIRQIWMVESGEYSDHRIHGVFEREEDAIAWAKAMAAEPDGWHSDASVGRIDYVPAGVAPFQVETWRLQVELFDDGRVVYQKRHPQGWRNVNWGIGWNPAPPPKRVFVRYVRAPYRHGDGGLLDIAGPTQEAVLKVSSEKIAMWRAGAWGGPAHPEIEEEGDV